MDDLMKELREMLDSEKLVTARLVDSVSRTAQLAGGATPEMQDLFSQWLSLISSQLMYEAESGEIDISEVSKRIGIKDTSLLSLILFMQRSGKISVKKIVLGEGIPDDEVCPCLKGNVQ